MTYHREQNDMPDDGERFDVGDVLELRNPRHGQPPRTIVIEELLPAGYAVQAAMSAARTAPPKDGERTARSRMERARRRCTEYQVKPLNDGGRATITSEYTLRESYRRIARGAEKEQAA